MRALLDVNVLIALLDGAHVHHGRASDWLQGNLENGWASCPITQNGCIRIMSQPAYPNAKPAAVVAQRLAEAAEQQWHEFWTDDVSLLEPALLDWSAVLGSRQVTDAYLVALAVRHRGRFVTFDGGIELKTVRGAQTANLVVL
jgi:toxin-antitoxin system PIN domain toxin